MEQTTSSEKPKVFITRLLPDKIMDELRQACDCTWWPESETPVPHEVLLENAHNVEGLLTMLTDRIDSSVFDAAQNLRVVSNLAVGFDNIDIDTARSRNITVCHTPDVLTESTADLTFALLMATARRLVESVNFVKEDKWTSWSPMLMAGQDINGKTLGIIGLGRIGAAVARRAKGFNMNVIYNTRHRKVEEEERLGIEYANFYTLLWQSDFICVLTPLTEETHHLVSSYEFDLMKESAILINTARGSVVDEEALVDALRERKIWGAGLDVYEQEPIRKNHPLLEFPNVVALPHVGSATVDTRINMAKLAVSNLILTLSGTPPEDKIV